jgi:hypothetical protein
MASSSVKTATVSVREIEVEKAQESSTERPADQQPAVKEKPFIIKIMTIVPG